MLNLEVPKTPLGNQTFAIVQSDYIDIILLAANTKEDHTIPTDAQYVVFNCVDAGGGQVTFWMNIDNDAAIPSADVTDGSGSEPNPTIRDLHGQTTISLIAAQACFVVMAFYK